MTNQVTLSEGGENEVLHPTIIGIRFCLAGECLGKLGSINGFLEKITHHPVEANHPRLVLVESAESIATVLKRNFKYTTINTIEWLLSDLPPSAAIVIASSISLCTDLRCSSKSLPAAFNHETGLVFLI